MPTPTPKPHFPRSACAACKHQRRRCAPDCPLAPYFTADRQSEFNNVHRLFGIKNVVDLLKNVASRDRDDTVKSIIYEANLRALRPVGGCYATIADFLHRIALCEAELNIVNQNLAFYKQHDNDPEMDFGIEENVEMQQFFNDHVDYVNKPILRD